MIYVRCDGGGTVGLGHASRCLAVSEVLARELGVVPRFLAPPDPVLAAFLDGTGCELLPLSSTGYGVEEVVARLSPADVMLSDTYALDSAALAAIASTGATHGVVDDFGRLDRWPVDVVVNPNVGSDAEWYPGAGAALVGPDYALLRAEITERIDPERPIANTGRRLLVCLGGGVWPAEADALLSALAAELGDAEIRVTTRERVPPGVTAVEPSSLPAQLEWAELAVLSGGVVKYEAAALGVPALLVAIVPHQEEVGTAFAGTGAARYLGALARLEPGEIAAAALRLARDPGERAELASAGRALVDGRGAERVTAALLGRSG